MDKILILGSTGQLGRAFLKLMPNALHASRDLKSPNFVDFQDPSSIYTLLDRLGPEIIVNVAAMTGVDECENMKPQALQVNGYSVKVLTEWARKLGSRLIHISTDYIFDGSIGNYSESSYPNPLNYYGLSKLIGDTFANSYSKSLIVRTSGLYGYSKNFPRFVYEQLKSGLRINAIKGFYSPIHANNLARAIVELINRKIYGIINVAGDRASRLDLSLRISEEFNFDRSLCTEKDKMASMIARRPFDSSLDISKAKNLLNFDFSSMTSNLREFRLSIEKSGT